MKTNDASLRPSRRRFGRATRAALLPLALAGAVAGTSVVAERDASASFVSSVASLFVKNAIGCIASGSTDNFGLCLLGGDTPNYSLSSTDLDNIKEVVSEALYENGLNTEAVLAEGIVSDASEYYRHSPDSLGALQASYDWAEQIHDDAEDVMDALVYYGLDAGESYRILATIRHAMLLEMYNIEIAKIETGLTPDPNGEMYLLTTTDLASFRTSRIESEAAEVAGHLSAWSDEVDSLFGTVTQTTSYSGNKLSKSDCFVFLVDNGYYKDVTSKWCYPDPKSSSGTTCYTYEYWQCSYRSGDNHSSSKNLRKKAIAEIAHQNAKISYRDEKLGELVYETIHDFQKAAAGDFEYCGNGTCALGEIGICSSDCTETSSATGDFDQWTSHASLSTSAPTTLLENHDAKLEWQSDGNFVLYAANNKVIWSSTTNNVADGLSFQSDGDLVLSSGSADVWHTGTTTQWGGNKATKMILVGEVLHLVDTDGTAVWNSETDWNRHSDGFNSRFTNPVTYEGVHGSRFCILVPPVPSTTPLLVNGDGDMSSFDYELVWQSDGNLAVVSSDDSVQWDSDTAGSGTYLCNQEDGNLAIYDDEYNEVWSTDTGYLGVGGDLQLMRNQLRVTAASGDILWVSGTCNKQDCKYAAQGTSSFSKTKSTSNQTILETGKAQLVLASDGRLKILKKATGSTLWQSSAGTTASFSSGVLKIDSTSLNSTAGSKLYLVDCNLFIGEGSTNATVYSTQTTCD